MNFDLFFWYLSELKENCGVLNYVGFFLNNHTFDNVEAAVRAKDTLHGADIYSGCCTLKIDFAKVSRSCFFIIFMSALVLLLVSFWIDPGIIRDKNYFKLKEIELKWLLSLLSHEITSTFVNRIIFFLLNFK